MSTNERWWFDAGTSAVRDENRLTVAYVPSDSHADGPLLAAAPAMLAALKRIAAARAHGVFTVGDWADVAAAIDSAEGR